MYTSYHDFDLLTCPASLFYLAVCQSAVKFHPTITSQFFSLSPPPAPPPARPLSRSPARLTVPTRYLWVLPNPLLSISQKRLNPFFSPWRQDDGRQINSSTNSTQEKNYLNYLSRAESLSEWPRHHQPNPALPRR